MIILEQKCFQMKLVIVLSRMHFQVLFSTLEDSSTHKSVHTISHNCYRLITKLLKKSRTLKEDSDFIGFSYQVCRCTVQIVILYIASIFDSIAYFTQFFQILHICGKTVLMCILLWRIWKVEHSLYKSAFVIYHLRNVGFSR